MVPCAGSKITNSIKNKNNVVNINTVVTNNNNILKKKPKVLHRTNLFNSQLTNKINNIKETTSLKNSNIVINISNNTNITKKCAKSIDKLFTTRHDKYVSKIEFNDPWGDYPSYTSKQCIIVFQNANGLSPSDKFSKLHMIGIESLYKNIDILGIAESNLDWNFSNVREKCYSIIKRYWNQTKIGSTCSTENQQKIYQPGGVLMITGNDWANCSVSKNDPSDLGRWTESTITGKQNTKVTIITAYTVCKNSISNCGPSTVFAQQWHILRRSSPDETIDPRKTMMLDLGNRIKELKGEGSEVILLIDANDSLQKPSSEFTKWAEELSLRDPLIHLHGTDDEPATHSSGSKRIDYILTTAPILDYVTSAGILPLHDLCISDHRAIFIDVDLRKFLQLKKSDTLTNVRRLLVSEDPRTVKKYQSLLSTALDESDIENKIKNLDVIIKSKNKEFIISEMEAIDQEFTAIKLKCEQECKTFYSQPYSPALKKLYYEKQFWNVWLSEKRISKRRTDVNFEHIRKKYASPSNQMYIKGPIHLSFIKSKLITAQHNLKSAALKADMLREAHLNDRATMELDNGNAERAKIINKIIKKEQNKKSFLILKRVNGKSVSGGLQHIIKENIDKSTTVISDKEEVFSELLKYAEGHFSKSDGTPFTIEPLISLIENISSNQTFDVDTLQTDNASKDLMKQLQKIITTEEISTVITYLDLIAGYKRWREKTSTSPSGLHLGHDKAVLKYIQTQIDKCSKNNETPLFERVFRIKSKLIEWALITTHSYNRWTIVINAMIEKLPGNPLINKLRVIHLLESDFNMMIGILWGRRVISKGEKINAFDEGQGGSRPDRRTQELLIQKHLSYGIHRLSQTNGASFDNDAQSCFDRIVMNVASACSQQLGMPKSACNLFLNTLNNMKYFVKTANGVSTKYYTSSKQKTMHGPGQGGRGSPAVWVIISSLMMKCINQTAIGSTFINPFNNTENYKQRITGFVDDITHWCADNTLTSSEILDEMQKTAQKWEQLLTATGGKLELTKCFFYLITWIFDKEGVASINTNITPSITIEDSATHQSITIKHKKCNVPHKSLGVLESPIFSNKNEYERLLTKAHSFAQKLSNNNNLCRKDVLLYYNMYYVPSMSYSMVVSSLSLHEANKIQGATAQKFLSRIGFNRNLPSEVTYGPIKLGGVGFRDLFTLQGTEKCMFLIRMLRIDRPATRIFRIYIQWCQRYAGMSNPILEDVQTILPQLMNEKWISTLRTFLQISQIELHISSLRNYCIQCSNDRHIMDIVCNSNLPKSTVIKINRCRLFLRATTISDISNNEGTQITLEASKCDISAQIINIGEWPVQIKPGPVHLREWKKLIDMICHTDSLQLEIKLSEWNREPIRNKRGTTAYINENDNTAIVKINNAWNTAELTSKRKRFILINIVPHVTTPSFSNLIPADIHHSASSIYTLKWRSQIKNNINTTESNNSRKSWSHYVTTLETWEQHLISFTYNMITIIDINKILSNENETIILVSDGGCRGTHGSFGWVMATADIELVKSQGQVPGIPMSSHRAEGFGKLSWLTYLNHYTIFHKININCTIHSYCDNMAIVNQTSTGSDYKKSCLAMLPNFDVLKAIYDQQIILKNKNIKLLDSRHVLGHQDKVKALNKLNRQETLNIIADEMASAALESISISTKHYSYTLPHCKAYLFMDEKIQSSLELYTFKWRHQEFQLQDYYCERWKLSIMELHTINWAGMRMARGKLTTGKKAFSIKLLIGWLAVGDRLKLYGNQITECTFCKEEENSDHILLCKSRKDSFETTLEKFNKYLKEIKTAPRITCALIIGLKQWGAIKIRKNSMPHSSLLHAMIEQSNIGWNLSTRGLFSKAWSSEQEKFYISINNTTLGDSWSSNISLWWINEVYSIWNLRNQDIHCSTVIESREEKETKEQVKLLYDQIYNISMYDRNMLKMPITDRLQQHPESLKIWLYMNKVTINLSVKEYLKKLTSGQQDIRKFCRKARQLLHFRARNHSSVITNINKTTYREQVIRKYFKKSIRDRHKRYTYQIHVSKTVKTFKKYKQKDIRVYLNFSSFPGS